MEILMILCLLLTILCLVCQVVLWVEYRAWRHSTHQVTYINPFTGKSFDRSKAKTSEVELGDIPNMTEDEKKLVQEALSEWDNDTIK